MTPSPHPPPSSPLTLSSSPPFQYSSVVTTTTTTAAAASKLSLRKRRREKLRLRNGGVIRSSSSSIRSHIGSSTSSRNGRTSSCIRSRFSSHRTRAPIPSFSPVINDDGDGDGDGDGGKCHGVNLGEGNEAGRITETTTAVGLLVGSKTVDGGKGTVLPTDRKIVVGTVVEDGDVKTMEHERKAGFCGVGNRVDDRGGSVEERLGKGGDVSLPTPKPIHDDVRAINGGGGDSAVAEGSNLKYGKSTIDDVTEETKDTSSLFGPHDGCIKELRTPNNLRKGGIAVHGNKKSETSTGISETESGKDRVVIHSRGDGDGDRDFDGAMDAEGKLDSHTITAEEKIEDEDEIPSPSAFAKGRKSTRSPTPPSGTDTVDLSEKESTTRRTGTTEPNRDGDTGKYKGVDVLGSGETKKESCRVDGSDDKKRDDGEPTTNKKVGRNEKAQLGDRTGSRGRLRLTRVASTKRKRHVTTSKTSEQPSINVATNTTGNKTVGSAVSKPSSVLPSGKRVVDLVSSPLIANSDASSPPLSTDFDVTRAKALFDREKELGRKHSYLLQQSKAGEALADEARRKRRTTNLNGVATAYPTIVSSFGATNTNSINKNRSSSINNNKTTTPLTSLQTMAHREQQDDNDNKNSSNPVSLARTDAEIERALLHRLARLEKSTAWFEHLRDKTGRELKRHRNGILKRRAKERERASLDGTTVEVWVEDEGGGRWRMKKRPRFLQDVEECGNEEGEECVPPLPRSLVNRAKIRTFAFRKKRQPTLTQMVNSDDTSVEGSDVEVVGTESETDGGESRVAQNDDDDDDNDNDNDELNPLASGNEVHQAFEAEAVAKSSDDGDKTETKGAADSTIDQNYVVVGTEPSEVTVEATDRNVKDYGGNCMLDLEKAVSRGAKAAFWWDASSKREIPPHDKDPFDLFGLQEGADSGACTKAAVAKVNKTIAMEDKKEEDEEACYVPNDEEGDCGLDDLLNLLESTENDREICTVIERPLTANKTSIPDNNDVDNKRHPPVSPTPNLTSNLLSISQRIVSDVLQNRSLLFAVRTARLYGGENDVDDWKDDVRYALSTTHSVANIEEALKNVRSRRRTMSCIAERVGRALKNRGMVLDLYVRVLEEALKERMKKEELAGGKNGVGDGVLATLGVEGGGGGLGASSICGQGAPEEEEKEEKTVLRVMEKNESKIMLAVD